MKKWRQWLIIGYIVFVIAIIMWILTFDAKAHEVNCVDMCINWCRWEPTSAQMQACYERCFTRCIVTYD